MKLPHLTLALTFVGYCLNFCLTLQPAPANINYRQQATPTELLSCLNHNICN